MSDKRRQISRSTKSSSSIVCENVSFVEVELPHRITPRLVISYSEGLSVLVENQAAIPLAAKFIIAFRTLERGGAL